MVDTGLSMYKAPSRLDFYIVSECWGLKVQCVVRLCLPPTPQTQPIQQRLDKISLELVLWTNMGLKFQHRRIVNPQRVAISHKPSSTGNVSIWRRSWFESEFGNRT